MELTDVRHTIYKPQPLEEVERNAILNALAYFSGNARLTANALGIARTTLYAKMKHHDIPVAERKRGRPIADEAA